MVLSLSVVLLLGVAVVVLCRYASLRIGHAIVCMLFGFYLAASPLAPTIDQAVSAIAGLISGR